MRKLILLLLGGVTVYGAQAQKRNLHSTAFGEKQEMRTTATPWAYLLDVENSAPQTANKGTAVPFVTEDFSSGTATTLPTGWARGGAAAGGWHWTKTAATSQFSGSLGVINSTTATNGWMIFDSDSIGSIAGIPTIFEGNLTSPAYNCTGHASVSLKFESYYKKLQDSCWVQVSSNNFTTFTEYQVLENNTLGGNGFSANPATVRINISAAAANQASVRLRFRYKNEYAGGTYAWMIDDLALSELDPVEVAVSLGGFVAAGPSPAYSDFSTYNAVPLTFVTPLTPLVALTNNGSAAQTNVPVTATISNGTSTVFNQVSTYASLPATAVDSIVEWTGTTSTYTPSAIGNYTGVFSHSLANDGVPANNTDTVRFSVTDSSYVTYANTITGGYYLHRPNTHSAGEGNFYFGTRFDVPTGKSDTLSSIGVSFGSGSAVGTKAVVFVYKLNETDPANMTWDVVAGSQKITLTANDISVTGAGGTRFAYFPMKAVSNVSELILGAGTYVAAVTTDGAAAASTVTVNATAAKYNAPGIVGFYGHQSNANNDGAADFASGVGIATGLRNLVPVIRMHFGRYNPNVGVGNIPGVEVGTAYPNPAINTVTLPVTTKESVSSVKVSLTSVVGQVIATQNVGQMSANATKNASFSTSGLSNGVYFLTVEANGARTTSRFVVAH